MSAEVTVVVPTRNRAEVLRATLHTILHQREVDLRLIVVDEASSDHTAATLQALDDPRLTVVRNDDPRGTAGARNTGLALVDTPWVAFCDDDDLWAPDKLRSQLDVVDDTVRWCCVGTVLVDEELTVLDHQPVLSGDVLDTLLAMNRVPGGGSGVLVSTDLLREVGGFTEELRNSEDWDCWISLAARSPLAAVDRPLVGYRIWSNSMSRDMERMEAAFDRITGRHAQLAAVRGVAPDREAHDEYLARQQVRSHRRLAAAKGYGRVARRGGSARNWARAAVALAAPSLLDRVGTDRAMRRVPEAWRVEAETWLAAVKRDVRDVSATP
jgi:glycosyltransferase involved in cell wall biosynthesis